MDAKRRQQLIIGSWILIILGLVLLSINGVNTIKYLSGEEGCSCGMISTSGAAFRCNERNNIQTKDFRCHMRTGQNILPVILGVTLLVAVRKKVNV